jgi:hypothetical protein
MDGLQSLAQASHRLSLFRLQGLFPQFGHGRRRSQARQANKNAASAVILRHSRKDNVAIAVSANTVGQIERNRM